jgi:hypothetical protein
MAGDISGDQPDERGAILARQQSHMVAEDRLIPRCGHLQTPWQVDPELNSVRQAAALIEALCGQFVMQDAGAGCHPLGVALSDHPAAAVAVVMRGLAVQQVRHRFESPVRMPRSALRLVGGIQVGTHLVQHQERVGVCE